MNNVADFLRGHWDVIFHSMRSYQSLMNSIRSIRMSELSQNNTGHGDCAMELVLYAFAIFIITTP